MFAFVAKQLPWCMPGTTLNRTRLAKLVRIDMQAETSTNLSHQKFPKPDLFYQFCDGLDRQNERRVVFCGLRPNFEIKNIRGPQLQFFVFTIYNEPQYIQCRYQHFFRGPHIYHSLTAVCRPWFKIYFSFMMFISAMLVKSCL